MFNICTKFQANVSYGFRVVERKLWKFAKEHNSVKDVGGFMVTSVRIV